MRRIEELQSLIPIGDLCPNVQVKSGLLPEDKMRLIEELRASSSKKRGKKGGGGVMMVGDGINDTPALASADVGVAVVRTPTEAAASVADVLLLRENQSGISVLPLLLQVAHGTNQIVMQNLVLASVTVVRTHTHNQNQMKRIDVSAYFYYQG
jgi:P-type E1-E2 ATPase